MTITKDYSPLPTSYPPVTDNGHNIFSLARIPPGSSCHVRRYHAYADAHNDPLLSALASALSALLLLVPMAQPEFILFPSLTATEHAGLNPHPDVHHAGHVQKQSEFEVLISNDEPLDIERLQAGGLAAPETTVRLGRHHSPLDYRNTRLHHGAYLQTSIQRPASSEFDDHGGIPLTILVSITPDELASCFYPNVTLEP